MEAQQREMEPRLFEGASVLWQAELVQGDHVVACLIVKISTEGAMVRTDEPVTFESPLTLRNPRIGERPAEITWRRHNEMGLRFLGDGENVAAIISQALR
jgi:hypothetical protein